MTRVLILVSLLLLALATPQALADDLVVARQFTCTSEGATFAMWVYAQGPAPACSATTDGFSCVDGTGNGSVQASCTDASVHGNAGMRIVVPGEALSVMLGSIQFICGSPSTNMWLYSIDDKDGFCGGTNYEGGSCWRFRRDGSMYETVKASCNDGCTKSDPDTHCSKVPFKPLP